MLNIEYPFTIPFPRMETIPDYDEYITKLLKYMDENNGKHAINPERAQQWINAQPIPEVRNVAKKLVDKIEYITFNDIHNYIENIITTNYKKIQDNPDNVIHMFIGSKEKSNYFLSILAIYYIKKHKYREPSLYFNIIPNSIINETINKKTEKNNKRAYLIYVDDMSYSGGQIEHTLSILMTNIYNNIISEILNNELDLDIDFYYLPENNKRIRDILEEKTPEFISDLQRHINNKLRDARYYNIEFMLLGLNDIVLNRLNEFNFRGIFDAYKTYLGIQNYNDLPFKVKYEFKYAKIYKTLDKYFTEEELFHIGYFFSFGRLPNVILYYDHKIADDTSTLLKILNYGPIVPKNYDIAHYWKNFRIILKKNTYEYITNNYFIKPFTKLFYKWAHQYYKKIMNDKFQNIREPIKFIPFINNCNQIKTVLNNPLMKYVNYAMFIVIENQGNYNFKKFIEKIHSNPIFSIKNLLDIHIKSDNLKSKIANFIIDINTNRCDLTFYKKWVNNLKKQSSKKSKISRKSKRTQKIIKKTYHL